MEGNPIKITQFPVIFVQKYIDCGVVIFDKIKTKNEI